MPRVWIFIVDFSVVYCLTSVELLMLSVCYTFLLKLRYNILL